MKERHKLRKIRISITAIMVLFIMAMIGFPSKADEGRPLEVRVKSMGQIESGKEATLQISIFNRSENTYPAEALRVQLSSQEGILERWRIVENDAIYEIESDNWGWQAIIRNELKPNEEISFEISGIAEEKFYVGDDFITTIYEKGQHYDMCLGQCVYVPMLFTDVSEDEWFYDYVTRVYNNRIMTGLTETTFGPAEELSRAQFATILWRESGEPEMSYEERFSDVAEGQFYTAAVLWAQSEGVITGYEDGRFGPSDLITREQMATMLYRYMVNCWLEGNKPETVGTDLSVFPDSGNVSEFSREAMSWAVEIGLIKGDNGRINPQGNASRAVCATIIARFDNYIKMGTTEE
ncbi:MAG: S-layer homology domain-containing protein [Dorea sp.]|nr:S-layer homology domain-containing protein [Dorea sp.]